MSLAVKEEQNVSVISIACHLDYSFASTFKEEVLGLIKAGKKNLVIDLGGVNFVDSSGLGALVSILRAVTGVGGDICLCGLKPNIKSMLELTRLNRIFEIHANVQDALEHMS